jgi:hypothetical protein
MLELIFWLKLSVLLTGFGKADGVTVDGVVMLGPVGSDNFDGKEVTGGYLDDDG